jgi:hypothetical protein
MDLLASERICEVVFILTHLLGLTLLVVLFQISTSEPPL